MPGASRTQRAEAKYNVTTDFPRLGLHSAAATGNIGLVKYALSHGQPVNSVLDGVLPLHAACSGGDEMVVKLLIESGADVNAPRLPRRYSNEKSRTSSQLIIGTSGSTPLHFASANGHTIIVLTLLLHGAHPDRPDKHGITPEKLARDNGFANTADLLRDWNLNKDRDLWEREEQVGSTQVSLGRGQFRVRQGSLGDLEGADGHMRRRLCMKRSIEFALSTWKSTTSHSHSQSGGSVATITSSAGPEPPLSPPPSGSQPLGSYTFYPSPSDSSDPAPRRPSLPHIYDAADTSSAGSRKVSTRSRTSSYKRPSSAGSGAEPPRRKLGTKYSLLNLFKKSSADGQILEYSSSSLPTEAGSSPSSAHMTPRSLHSSKSFTFSDKMSSPVDESLRKRRSRLKSDGMPRVPNHVATAFELDTAMSHERLEHSRARSGSGSTDEVREASTPAGRPGPSILKGHLRSSSSQSQFGQNQNSGSGRSLRFDSSSTTSSSPPGFGRRTTSPRPFGMRGPGSPSPARHLVLKASESVNSLKSGELLASAGDGRVQPASAPPVRSEFESGRARRHEGGSFLGEDEEDEEYGEVIRSGMGLVLGATELGSGPDDSKTTQGHSKGQSFASDPLSPIMSPSASAAEFPFSIQRPPSADIIEGARPPHFSQSQAELKIGVTTVDNNRVRGDSVSSTSTNGSVNQPLSSSSTSGSASAGVVTPSTTYNALPVSTVPMDDVQDLAMYDNKDGSRIVSLDDAGVGLPARRPHVPIGIDIRSISSHAQAEALVRWTQRSILDMDQAVKEGLDESNAADLGLDFGRSPLSAKLAAYGQSLAIERQFKKEEGKGDAGRVQEENSGLLEHRSQYRGPTRSGSRPRITAPPRVKKVRRPHTSAGTECSGAAAYGSHPPRAQHGLSRSTSVHISMQTGFDEEVDCPSTATGIEIVETAATPVDASRFSAAQVQSTTPLAYRNLAALDPEPERASLESSSASSMMGAPLSRVSTAPCEETYNAVHYGSGKSRRDNVARHMASANKLSRMGFVAPDSRQASSLGYSSSHAENKQRFGGLKSFVQSLKGRS